MKMNAQKRIPYLDFLKFFAIASVLLGHSVEQITGNDFWDNPIWAFIYTYHMPLFMLLCGYFFGSSLKLSFADMTKKKFVQLGIPSISAWVLMYLFVTLTGYNPYPEIVDLSFLGFMNALWFLKCVFFCYLIGWVFIKLVHNVWIAALTSIILTHLIPVFNIDSVNFMLPMFWVGYLCNLYQTWIDRYRIQLLVGSLLAFSCMLPFWSGRLTVYMVPIQIFDWSNFVTDWSNLGITLYRMAIGITGSMIFFLLSPYVYNKIKYYDTLKLAKEILTGEISNYKLSTIAKYFNISFCSHRAIDDAFATAKIFLSLAKTQAFLGWLSSVKEFD